MVVVVVVVIIILAFSPLLHFCDVVNHFAYATRSMLKTKQLA